MRSLNILCVIIITNLLVSHYCYGQSNLHPDNQFSLGVLINEKANGFKGIWYMNQPSNDISVYKYSGGMATYTAKHRPFAIYSEESNKTFFCFGGTDETNSTL